MDADIDSILANDNSLYDLKNEEPQAEHHPVDVTPKMDALEAHITSEESSILVNGRLLIEQAKSMPELNAAFKKIHEMAEKEPPTAEEQTLLDELFQAKEKTFHEQHKASV